jgi:hypothetical protein
MAAKKRKRRGHKRHSFASIDRLILKAVESAGRKGIPYHKDKRVKVLMKEQQRLKLARDFQQDW